MARPHYAPPFDRPYDAARGVICPLCGFAPMQPARVHRLPRLAVVLGWVLLIPSAIGFFFAVILLLTAPAEAAGAAARAAALIALASSAAAVPGLLLTRKRDVRRCPACGHTVRRV